MAKVGRHALTDDPRFKDPAWASTPYGQFLMKWYEAAGQTAQRVGDLGTSLPPPIPGAHRTGLA
ncbi:MAG: hypothetical protein EOP82_04125 [Variovorax sp.]|nr:MAG: hypothetical protein EOP82_04125 [Variovorax sp.]